MQSAHQSRNGACVASCSFLSLGVGLFLGLALTRQSGATKSSSPTSSVSSSDISSRSSSTPFNSVSSCRSNFPSSVSPLHNAADLHRLVESGLTTHCPCQLKTGPVSFRQNPHVHRVHTILQVKLDHCPISKCFECADSCHPPQDLLQNRSLETVPVCIVLQYYPHCNTVCIHMCDEWKISIDSGVCHRLWSIL